MLVAIPITPRTQTFRHLRKGRRTDVLHQFAHVPARLGLLRGDVYLQKNPDRAPALLAASRWMASASRALSTDWISVTNGAMYLILLV